MPQPVKSQEEFVAEMKGEMLENSSHFYLIQIHAGTTVCIKVGITLQPQVELRRWKFTDKKGKEALNKRHKEARIGTPRDAKLAHSSERFRIAMLWFHCTH